MDVLACCGVKLCNELMFSVYSLEMILDLNQLKQSYNYVFLMLQNFDIYYNIKGQQWC